MGKAQLRWYNKNKAHVKIYSKIYYQDKNNRARRIQYGRKWRQKNPKKQREMNRKWSKAHSLRTTEGTYTGLNRRAYPPNDRCEMCNRVNSSKYCLHYHHWDDKNMNNGIWICVKCHRLCEAIERGNYKELIKRYLYLKEIINEPPPTNLKFHPRKT